MYPPVIPQMRKRWNDQMAVFVRYCGAKPPEDRGGRDGGSPKVGQASKSR